MRILFLGRSRVGKTSVIARGLAELTLLLGSRTTVDDRVRLGRVRRAVDRGRPPRPTRGLPVYRTRLRDRTWLDCADHDGRLLERSAADERMLAAPSMAEALVLTVDAPSLTRVSASSDVARLAVVVRRWIHERGPSGTEPSRLLPVVLAITHMDQLDKNKTLEEVVALFDPLRAVGATSSRITGLTVSVNAGSPSGHCALPLLWGLRHGIPAMANEVTAVWPVGPLPAWSWGSNGFDRKRATWHP